MGMGNFSVMQGDGGARNKKPMGSKMPSNDSIIAMDSEEVAELIAHMSYGTDEINALIDSMKRNAEYLEGVWKGETKEVFIQELAVLHRLVKENSAELKSLVNTIRNQNRLAIGLQIRKNAEARELYESKQ